MRRSESHSGRPVKWTVYGLLAVLGSAGAIWLRRRQTDVPPVPFIMEEEVATGMIDTTRTSPQWDGAEIDWQQYEDTIDLLVKAQVLVPHTDECDPEWTGDCTCGADEKNQSIHDSIHKQFGIN